LQCTFLHVSKDFYDANLHISKDFASGNLHISKDFCTSPKKWTKKIINVYAFHKWQSISNTHIEKNNSGDCLAAISAVFLYFSQSPYLFYRLLDITLLA